MEPTRKGLTTKEQLEVMKKELSEASKKAVAHPLKKKPAYLKPVLLVTGLLLLILIFLSFQAFAAKSSGKSRNVFGYYFYALRNDNMAPTLPSGSVILSYRPVNTSALKTGTVITYYNGQSELVTARISRVIKDDFGHAHYYAKTDNPKDSPELIAPDRIESVYLFRVPLV